MDKQELVGKHLKVTQDAVYLLAALDDNQVENISDGYHTFKELYEFRKVYNAVLFNEWGSICASYETSTVLSIDGKLIPYTIGYDGFLPKYDVHKSWRHHDGELCFGGGWFIVSAMLPTGLISNHYKAEDWDLFRVPICEKALFEYDNHTPQDVLERLKNL